MDSEEEEVVATGFDRGVSYSEAKDVLVKAYKKYISDLGLLDPDEKNYVKKKGILLRKEVYSLISIIQLRNGSRISEAVEAFKKFMKKNTDFYSKVIVKIAKSKTTKYKKGTDEKFTTKTRFRKMIFPTTWIDLPIVYLNEIREFLEEYGGNLKKRVLDFLFRNFEYNTHSLRYAFINHMLYEEKKEMALVAKFVGHTNVSQLVRYTQAKETDKLFDLDI